MKNKLFIIIFIILSIFNIRHTFATAQSNIINKNNQNIISQLPPNTTIWTKQEFINYIQNKIKWSSYSWTNRGNYYSIFIYPAVKLDNKLMVYSVDRKDINIELTDINYFNLVISQQGIDYFINNFLTADKYYIYFDNEHILNSWSIYEP